MAGERAGRVNRNLPSVERVTEGDVLRGPAVNAKVRRGVTLLAKTQLTPCGGGPS